MPPSRNPYAEEVDFTALALTDGEWATFVKNNRQVNFGDPEAVKQLTKSLLKRDFNLSIHLLDDRLCPPVPNRLNYILWLQDLLDQTSNSYDDAYDANRQVVGLDIACTQTPITPSLPVYPAETISGTGASCIYPLLATTTRPQWRMYASDIDPTNHANAAHNIDLNKLSSRIRLLPLRTASSSLIPLDSLPSPNLDFVMTNPPFYSSLTSMNESATLKARPPNSACTGAEVEMIYADGGEVGFVRRLIDESCHLRRAVQWYSSMLGKLSSVGELVSVLKEKGCSNWCVTEFVQGQKTRRWAIAWSWSGRRPEMATARGVGPGIEKAWLPWASEVTIPVDISTEETEKRTRAKMEGLDLKWQWNDALHTGIGLTKENVWSRAARRKRQQQQQKQQQPAVGDSHHHEDHMDEDEAEGEDGAEAALVFKLRVARRQENMAELQVRWLVGQDSVLFESFCGMLKRAMTEG